MPRARHVVGVQEPGGLGDAARIFVEAVCDSIEVKGVGAWHLLDSGPREILRADLGCDDTEWERGKAWAFAQAMGLVWYYVSTNPTMASVGRRSREDQQEHLPVLWLC